MRPIKVLVVEDSMVFRELLVQSLGKDPGIQVVGTAKDPFEARDAILEYKPDVMTLDVELPRMSGIEFLRKLIPQYPLPVVVISSLSDKVFDAMNAGAVAGSSTEFCIKRKKSDYSNRCFYRRHRGDLFCDERLWCRSSWYRCRSAYAPRIYGDVCEKTG